MSATDRIIVAGVEEERALTGTALERAMKKHGRSARQQRMLAHRTERLAYAVAAVATAALLVDEQANYTANGTQRRTLEGLAGTLDELFGVMRAQLAPMIADDEEVEAPRVMAAEEVGS